MEARSTRFCSWRWASREAAAGIERVAMGTVLAASICGAIWPRWLLLLPVSAYFLAEALAGWHQGGFPFSEWTPVARAPTYVVPLALALLAAKGKLPGAGWLPRRAAAMWALRLAAAAVFLAHGIEALYLHPRFIDLILSSGWSLAGVRLSESGASDLLRVIGVLDVALAAAILIKPWWVVLGWMAFWTGLAAVSRLTAHGWGAYPELLVRAGFVLGPLALWALLEARRRVESMTGGPAPAAELSEAGSAPRGSPDGPQGF